MNKDWSSNGKKLMSNGVTITIIESCQKETKYDITEKRISHRFNQIIVA